jgi:broad specificity phosphatase PhoE
MGGTFSKKKAIVPTVAPDAVQSDSATDLGAADLGQLLAGSGITKIVLIRHANAAPRNPEAAAVEAGTVLKPNTPFANAWTVGDLTRDLTDKGREQASAAKVWLDVHELKGVITSEAARAYLTKDIMAPGASTLTLHTLHPSRSGTPECEKMFDTLGYGTLNTYFADRSVPGCEGRGKAIFRNYQSKVTRELHQLIAEGLAEKVLSGEGDTVAVFGHAVFLNAVAIAVSEAFSIPDAEASVAVLELGEAEGIMCDSGQCSIHVCKA